MSAKFIWVRNPTAINGKATTYVSLRGDDVNGDGTAQNPYRSLAKATTVAADNTNIMIGDGYWKESFSMKRLKFWGNTNTQLYVVPTVTYSLRFYYLTITSLYSNMTGETTDNRVIYLSDCSIFNVTAFTGNSGNYAARINATRCLLVNVYMQTFSKNVSNNCICYNIHRNGADVTSALAYNSIIMTSYYKPTGSNNNFVGNSIPSSSKNSINNSSTHQTISDYFNYVHPSVLAEPANATINEWLACDFTAKAGSANIGAGNNGVNIGLNEGFVCHVTNDSNDIFNPGNGAILRNIGWNLSLHGYMLEHVDKGCVGATSNTITLAGDAEPTDDYYNNLFIGITNGSGYGEIHRIIDYDGTTKIATIDGTWTTLPDTDSVYSISGTIESATKDFGKIIQVDRNWAFCYNMASWSDSNDPGYEMWKEFITTPLYNETTQQWELRPCGSFRYEYSLDGIYWYNSAELIAGTNSDNKTYANTYGNASELYVANQAKMTRLRYARFYIEIGFNIGKDA